MPTRGDATGAGPLRSVSAVSDNEVWVVGDGHDGVPYVGRGGGGGIDRVVVPQVRAGDWLRAVAAEPGRAAIVGSRGGRALIVTSGSAWKVHEGPDGVLHGVDLRGKDGWAVGNNGDEPLVMRLSGGSWKPVALPDVKGGYLRDVPHHQRQAGGRGRRRLHRRRHHAPADPALGRQEVAARGPARRRRRTLRRDRRRRRRLLGVGLRRRTPQRGLPAPLHRQEVEALRGEAAAATGRSRLQSVVRTDGLTMAVGHVLADDHYTDLVETFGPAEPSVR